MIVGQFNDSFQPITDGVATVTRQYALHLGNLLGENGCSYVITPSCPGYIDDDQAYRVIRYRSMPSTVRPPYRIGLPDLDATLRKTLQAIPFDLVHTHCPFGSGRLALKIAQSRHIPLVASFHTKYYEDIVALVKSEKIAKSILKSLMSLYHKADAVWTVNDASIGTLREYGYRGPVQVIGNGTDLTAALPESRRSAAAGLVASQLQILEHEPVLFFIGQHVWQKNLRLLCDALKLLKDRLQPAQAGGPAFRMFFVGGGDAETELREIIAHYGLESEVSFLGIIRDRDFVRGLYERADLLLFPSLYDTSSLVLRESAAALCPVVLISGSTIAEGIVDGGNGYLSDNDASAFADRIIRALADRRERQAVGLQAQKTFYRSWSTVVAEVYAAYQQIILRKAQQAGDAAEQ